MHRLRAPDAQNARIPRYLISLTVVLLLAGLSRPAAASDIEYWQEQFVAGRYQECIAEAARVLGERRHAQAWSGLKAEAELATGRPADAKRTVEQGLKRSRSSLRLRVLGAQACLMLSETEPAGRLLDEIDRLASQSPRRYVEMEDLLALGDAALLRGGDPRDVLQQFFLPARRLTPQRREPWLAIGNLALTSGDFDLAADVYEFAVRRFPRDADVWFGLALAHALDEPARSEAALKRTLELNPRLVAALLLRADQLIDADRLAQADNLLRRAVEVNPQEADAWAYRAVLAHLTNDHQREADFRDAALQRSHHPMVDHLIGVKLSQKYRFSAGVEYQRRALQVNAEFVPAQVQLSQDLLRLGREEEGWAVAADVNRQNRSEAVSHNLLELRERLAEFRRLETDDFLIRMETREADLYGERVLEVLTRARQVLCAKYGLELNERITVDIFPQESDFAVRTFGMPGASGYLGVCFGKVITANSPASYGENPANWESVLWHEFCHVVTLELTRNRMPRWLSEGISVYEEAQADPTWGQPMTPRYRRMILAGELTPIAALGGAFVAPESDRQVQFAYFQSALVVEFLVEQYGLESLKGVLRDLGTGLSVEDALQRHAAPVAALDQAFARFARTRAEQLAPQVDWQRPEREVLDCEQTLRRWVEANPSNYSGLKAYAESLLDDRQWGRAKPALRRLIELYPGYTGGDNAYEMLAGVHRQLNETDEERNILRAYVVRAPAPLDALLRLLELDLAAGDWQAALETSRRVLAINPLIPQPYRATVRAAEPLGKFDQAITAYRALLTMQPNDHGQIHYDLARLLHQQDDPSADGHALTAVETTPGSREARRLLLQIRRKGD